MIEIKKRISDIMDNLPPRLKDMYDTNVLSKGVPYIQHIPQDVDIAQYEFLKICSEVLGSDVYIKGYPNSKPHRLGIIGRYLDDSGNSLLYKTWNRFMCIDDLYREWEQSYYCSNNDQYNIYLLNHNHPELIKFFRNRKIETIINK